HAILRSPPEQAGRLGEPGANKRAADRCRDRQALWTDRLDREFGDFFALQNEITGRIANALNLELVGVEAARPTDQPEALDYIFRGRAAYNKGSSREAFAEAIDQYERALVLDPGSVEVQSLLADAL